MHFRVESTQLYEIMETANKQMKTFVFICSISEISFIHSYKEYNPDDIHFIAVSREIAAAIRTFGRDCSVLFQFLPTHVENDLRKKVLLWIEEWSEKAVGDAASLKSLLEYKDFSLWWFALPVLFPDVLRCVQYIEALEYFLDTMKVKKVAFISPVGDMGFPLRLGRDRELPNKIIDLVCRRRGIQIDKRRAFWKSRFRTNIYNKKIKLFYEGYYRIGIHVISGLRRLILDLGKESGDRPQGPTLLALSSMLYWREAIDEHGNMAYADTVANSSLVELKRRGYHVVGVDVELNTPSWKRLSGLFQKRNDPTVRWTAMEGLTARIPAATSRQIKSRLHSIYTKWENAGLFDGNMQYGSYDLAPLLRGRTEFLFQNYFSQAISYIEALDVSLKRWNPKLMLIVYEEGPHGRAACLVGQQRGIPTIALQHGTLTGPYVPAYFFKTVRYSDSLADRLACPIPTKTGVYGQHTKEMLINVSAYPKYAVEIVGMPSQDHAIKTLRSQRLDGVYHVTKVNRADSIILVISQPFLTVEDKKYYISVILEAAEQLPSCNWVVKLHPSESGQEWKRVLAKSGRNGNVSITKGNTQAWLLVSSLVVAWFSTTMLEAVQFGKPVLAIRIPGCANADDYIRDGIAYGVNEVSGLVNFVQSHFSSKEGAISKEQANTRSHYVLQSDRYASELVADLVEGLIQ